MRNDKGAAFVFSPERHHGLSRERVCVVDGPPLPPNEDQRSRAERDSTSRCTATCTPDAIDDETQLIQRKGIEHERGFPRASEERRKKDCRNRAVT